MSLLSNINAAAFVVASILCCLFFNLGVWLWFKYKPSGDPVLKDDEEATGDETSIGAGAPLGDNSSLGNENPLGDEDPLGDEGDLPF